MEFSQPPPTSFGRFEGVLLILGFLLRRLTVAVPTLFVVATLAFFMMHAAPGNPFDTGRKLAPAVERHVREKFGLDRPLLVQYARYLGGIAHGDFGPSLKYQDKTAASLIISGFPKSLTLGAAALALAAVVGISLGVLAAMHHNQAADFAATSLAVLGVCVPTFVTAPLLVLLFASTLGWLPTAGWGGVDALILPVVVLSLPQLAIISRLTRAGLIEELRSDHVRTARAKGLSEWRVMLHHALPGALAPLISYLGPATAGLITGSMVVEEIFGLPGLGKYFVISALQRDYTVVMAVVILYAALIVGLNLLSELLHAAVDRRIKLT